MNRAHCGSRKRFHEEGHIMANVEFSLPVVSLSGRIGSSQMVFYSYKGKPCVRAFTAPSNPVTGDQAAVRAYLAAAAKAWAGLTDAQRTAWTEYSESYYQTESNGVLSAPAGAQVYNKIAFYRQAQGLALPTDAPDACPPASLSGFEQASAGAVDAFNFTVEHSLADVTDHMLLARITPAIASGCTPSAKHLRYIAGVDADSFVALPASGADAAYTGARYEIADGATYRAELTILSPECVPSLSAASTFSRVIE